MNQLMTPQQVFAQYGVTCQELAEWRRKKIGPAYYMLGTRVIRYMPENVNHWFRDPANSRWHASRQRQPDETWNSLSRFSAL